MEPFQERVMEEKAELDKKREALRLFIESDNFQKLSYGERHRLRYQANVMRDYSIILDERIQAFPSEKPPVPNTQIYISELETRLKETLTVLRDVVAVMRHEPTVQGPRYKDLGIRANRILSEHRM